MKEYKSDYMLETLVKVFLLVYNLSTSNKERLFIG